MIKKLLFTLLLTLAIGVSAQTNTITIDWSFGSNPSASGATNASRTIEVGDTVTWNWYASGTHNVNSKATANENFESAFFGNGGTFSYTFTSVGTNDYQCDPHPGSMFGTITVVSEGTLSTSNFDKVLESIKIFPNPADSRINIDFNNQNSEELKIEVFNLLGKKVLAKKITKTNASLLVSELTNGVYLMKITDEDNNSSTSKRFVKI